MQIQLRPFTDEERNTLLQISRAIDKGARQERLVKYFLVFLGLLFASALLERILPILKKHELVCIALAALGTVLLVRLWEHRERLFWRLHGSGSTHDEELKNGVAEIATFDVTDAIAVDESEDEGPAFYLAIASGKVLFLSGQYLYEYEDSKQFPSTRFQLIRTPKMKEFLALKPLGEYLPPSHRRRAFSKTGI